MIINRELRDWYDSNGQPCKELIVSYVATDGTIKYLRYAIPASEMFEWEYSHSTPYNDPIVKSFDNIYAEILNEQKEDFNQNWKERLTNKFNEFVKIKKTNTEDAKFVADAGLEKIKSLVDNGQLYVAAEELDKLSDDVWTKNQKLQEWAMRVKSRKEFLNLINSITAKSLAAMKVKFLKNM